MENVKRINAMLDRYTARHPDTSWCLDRVQGTGLRYWKLTVSTKDEWQGDHHEFEAKTLVQVIDLADLWFVKEHTK